MSLHLTWPRMWVATIVTAVITTVVALLDNDDLNTWGVNVLTGVGVCVVAGVMTIRTIRAQGWSPRVFLFTWWMWMIGFRFLLLAYQSSDLPDPANWLLVAARVIVATATIVLILVLLSRSKPPDEIDGLLSRTLLKDGEKGSQWR